jgi:hypothetical protein
MAETEKLLTSVLGELAPDWNLGTESYALTEVSRRASTESLQVNEEMEPENRKRLLPSTISPI